MLISCSDKKKQEIDFSKVPEITPIEILRFDRIGDVYFSHLGYTTIYTAHNDLIIPDRQLHTILLVDSNIKIKNKLNEGRGPGEIIDAYEFTQDNTGNIYVYDSGNKKVMQFDSELKLLKEIQPKPYEGKEIASVYPVTNENYVFELTSFDFLMNKEKENEKIFIQYDAANDQYGKKIIFKDKPYARTFINDKLVGAMPVPYSDTQLSAYNPENRTLLNFDTSTSIIVELDFNFDTLRVIPINLPVEKLSNEEINSIKNDIDDDRRVDQWKTMKPFIPEFKSKADKMLFHDNNIWLQSNLRGDSQKWFVLNMEGKIIKVVHLPKDVMVTHISEHHLGIRLDDSTFALFEAVE